MNFQHGQYFGQGRRYEGEPKILDWTKKTLNTGEAGQGLVYFFTVWIPNNGKHVLAELGRAAE